MLNLILLATAPVIIILVYVYMRDKYEKEPWQLLLKSLLAGMLITLPIGYGEHWFSGVLEPFKTNNYTIAFCDAFLVASLWEEAFKLLAVMLLVWNNRNFNEKFDGIVYAVFVSLGFALVENILYVFNTPNSVYTGIARAFTAVPAHAMFGVAMGFYLGMARFGKNKTGYLLLAFFSPFVLHGLYDFILMAQKGWLLLSFAPFMVYMYIRIKKRMKTLSDQSVFKPTQQ